MPRQAFNLLINKQKNQPGGGTPRVQRGRPAPLTPRFDPALPIAARRSQIAATIGAHQVVVVCGETGSGKSTQIPKICLALGRGAGGYIGHTQPRRIAARSVAARIADELGVRLGDRVGYKVRFNERVGDDCQIKLVTDGMLLAEIEHDRQLRQYDTLIIDEAHERSLNIDFLLGYLRRLLPRRPELKVIITSATIDPQRFSTLFGGAPVIEVSGRSYPVELRYRPHEAGDSDRAERDMEVGVLRAVDELTAEGPGDILVFLPGERDIRVTAELLRRRKLRHTEILPLYARLAGAEQQRIFQPHAGRRIVLATNIAETSLTVPGIRYVIDSGLARISRYRPGRQVQGLPVEAISQASAAQRAGRCGRVADGICIRLYSEDDFAARPAFTDPEIQRTPLSAAILKMAHLGLGQVDAFPFLDPPSARAINDGYRQLEELGAMDRQRRLTALGRRLAHLPVDPRLGRMLLEAERKRCVSELLTIASALSIVDPREYPAEHLEAARARHAQDAATGSDFANLLALWSDYREQTRALNERRCRRYCRERFLSYVRMREWADIRSQLSQVARQMKLTINTAPAPADAIHRAILAGLLGNIACRDEQHQYLGTHGKKLHIHPSSAAFKKAPKWLMAAELVETGRLYARVVARIDPAWVEPLASPLLRRQYLEPYWDARRGRVMAYERVVLFGLTIVNRRRVHYGPVDPAAARQIFIQQALVTGDLHTDGNFAGHNRELIAAVEELEHRSRRRDILVDDQALHAFYAQRVPPQIHTSAAFERWRRVAERDDPQLLHMSRDYLMQHAGDDITAERFPDEWPFQGNRLRLSYHFEPGHRNDGVTVHVPLPLLDQLSAEPFSWLVPGLMIEKMIALIRSLPKPLRRHFAPATEYAEQALAQLDTGNGTLEQAFAAQLSRVARVTVSAGDWDLDKLPVHLRMNYAAVDTGGQVIDSDRDLAQLRHRLERSAARRTAAARPAIEREDLTSWDFETLPVSCDYQQAGLKLTVFPALVDEDGSVAIRALDNPAVARAAHRSGVVRLARRALIRQEKYLRRNLPGIKRMCLDFARVGKCEQLIDDLLATAFADAFPGDPARVRERQVFVAAVDELGRSLVATANRLCAQIAPVLADFRRISADLDSDSKTDSEVRQQLKYLVYPGFVANTPAPWRESLQRYMTAIAVRRERAGQDRSRDTSKARILKPHWDRLLLFRHRLHQPLPEPLLEYRWMIEEFRVSVFAQQLGTQAPVSTQRLDDAWVEVRRSLLD